MPTRIKPLYKSLKSIHFFLHETFCPRPWFHTQLSATYHSVCYHSNVSVPFLSIQYWLRYNTQIISLSDGKEVLVVGRRKINCNFIMSVSLEPHGRKPFYELSEITIIPRLSPTGRAVIYHRNDIRTSAPVEDKLDRQRMIP